MTPPEPDSASAGAELPVPSDEPSGNTVRIQGHWYPARSSKAHLAIVDLSSAAYRLQSAAKPDAVDTDAANSDAVNSEPPVFVEQANGNIDDLKISDRIGRTARRIHFADESQFETFDNDAMDLWLRSSKHKSGRSLPAAAKHIAHALPVSTHEVISGSTLATMDKWLLDPSELEKTEQEQIRQRFESLVASGPDDGFEFRLHFRQMIGIPNAFALPSGDIIVTDALAQLVENPDELDSIMLHEIGHVMERHGMRQVIEASTLSLVFSLMVGDVGGVAQLAAGIPRLEATYNEMEADKDEGKAGEASDRQEEQLETAPDWYSTHPDSESRARRAMEVSREMQLQALP